VKNIVNFLGIAVLLLLANVMFAQQSLGDAARDSRESRDSRKAASADLPQRKVVHREIPVYPPEAKAKRIQGIVSLEAVIDKQGNVIRARVIRGDKVFWESALTAIKAWKFDPANVEETQQIKIGFCEKSCW
jgi:TonB family protein